MKNTLAQYFSLQRRYSRSVNLERDLDRLDALDGYIPTERAVDALRRISMGLKVDDFSDANRAWTLTSVYGTGKSAFAHYLASLLAPTGDPMQGKALEISRTTFGEDSPEYRMLVESIPEAGLLRAVATGAREPIAFTILRALSTGAQQFWHNKKGKKPAILSKLAKLEASGDEAIESQEIVELVQEVARVAKTGVFLIIDELGKNLEYAAYNEGSQDLYLLQQLAELPKNSETPIYLLGILHQSFDRYSQRLASVQRNEWAKIQGRFEDISFAESAGQMMRLMAQAIDCTQAETVACAIYNQASEWFYFLENTVRGEELTLETLRGIYPLHPLSALVLPTLCQRYAQNDRSLFTFLTSSEPYSFQNFLDEVSIDGDRLPTLKLDRVYDYFIEAAGMGLASRPNLQRWVEIQDAIADARYLDPDCLRVLKAIGVLNLVTATGATRATRKLVALAMCHSATEETQYWEGVIEELLRKNLITHRRQLDELRIWQGSDFNADSELAAYVEKERSPLVGLLSNLRPLKPLVAQRHSYRTGTLRYFERHYLDAAANLTQLRCSSSQSDGFIIYWVDEELPTSIPTATVDGKPLIMVRGVNLDVLRMQAREFAALKKIQSTAPELQTDGVARREVRYRLVEAERLLDETLDRVFDVAANPNSCWIQGKPETIDRITDFNSRLSGVCDEVYHQSPCIWNELIDRRELTSQGAKARRELIEALVERCELENLGFEGYGPEVSMYRSLLGSTQIHRCVDGEWGIYPPEEDSKVGTFWQAIEEFCLEAKDTPQTIDRLYHHLSLPPYGIKPGAIPVMLAAVLLYRVDEIGFYQDGTFVPIIGSEHFELLVKDPSRFAVKYFEVLGLRSAVFKELEAILRQPHAKKPKAVRNATLLTVVTPLYQFVSKLPTYTQQTQRLSEPARAVLQALRQTTEPDELLFTHLPQACDLPAIGTGEADDGTTAKALRSQLVQILREIHTAYETLLSECQGLLHSAFGVSSREQKLREELRVRAQPLVGKCVEPILRGFTQAAVEEGKGERPWLEGILTIVADKTVASWTDENVTGFEMKLSDVARRFKNLEALQKEVATKGKGFEARRMTVTRPDGKETHRMVWIENGQQEQIDRLIEEVLQKQVLQDNPQLQEAFVVQLVEKVLGSASKENLVRMRKRQEVELTPKRGRS
ncbi:MAG: hypothetical protein SWY16_24935 [Cyanobacteriota bacterium]|nr:hypothetical protein [Cyanobacteriota bacterium]